MFNFYITTRALRSESHKKLLAKRTKLKYSENDIAYRGCLYWNQVKLEVKELDNTDAFKYQLKPYGTSFKENG